MDSEPTDVDHYCARPECRSRLALGVFACRAHWYQLPPELRRGVIHGWNGVLRGDGDMRDRLAAYRAAREAAIAFWAGE